MRALRAPSGRRSLILSCELEVRRRAYELVSEGQQLGAALDAVTKDAGHRERYFLAPFTLSASSASMPSSEYTQDPKGGGKSKGKGQRTREFPQPYNRFPPRRGRDTRRAHVLSEQT